MEIFKVIFILSALMVLGDGRRSQKEYQINIDENGTRYNETVEINAKENSVVYKVPKHNNVAQSETYFDYKTGYFATRIPELKECYIQPILKGQSSPRYIEKYLQRYRLYKKSRSTVPVNIIATTVIKERRIDPRELSSSFLAFCGDFMLFKSRKVYHQDDYQGKRNEKNGKEVSRFVRSVTSSIPISVPSSIGIDVQSGADWTTVTFNKCKKLRDYIPELRKGNCAHNSDIWEYHCRVKTRTCMYTVKCKLTNTMLRGKQIRCDETHIFTGFTCCDLKCPSN